MLIEVDAKQLEWVVAAWLSKDKIAQEEIINEIDTHHVNQTRFTLPSRLIAKKFLFRLLYGGQGFTYAYDPEFGETSKSVKFWDRVIESFYEKYMGLARWHREIVQQACRTKTLRVPHGREWSFSFKGDKVPRTEILNYPVQGTAADLMAVARTVLCKLLKMEVSLEGKFLLVSTVHDSILIDCDDDVVDEICRIVKIAFDEVPLNFYRRFGVEFTLPFRFEIKVGRTWGTMLNYNTYPRTWLYRINKKDNNNNYAVHH
jgi:DNA polymerase I-like protein with 3'-5' exonuclease and polymerase domains